MRQVRPQSPEDWRLGASAAPPYGPGSPYTQSEHYYALDSGQSQGGYPLADESAQQRGQGAKRVATTLGRGQSADSRHLVAVDPNARVASAIYPQTVPGAQVRVYSEPAPAQRPVRIGPPRLNYLRPLIAREPASRSWLFGLIALLISGGFLALVLHFAVPASGTGRAHAAIVAGRLIATQYSMRYVPTDPFVFVNERWVASDRIIETEDGGVAREYFPKDPAGLPLIYATCYWLALNEAEAIHWVHLVNPIAAALAVLATFFLCRFVGGSFLGLLGMLAMAASTLLLGVATDASGAAISLAFITWGFCLLIWWWRSGSAGTGLLAGILLGGAATVRYTDALLLIPLALACIMAWHWRRPLSSFLRAAVPILSWALPVAALLWWNQREMGAPTAYHLGGELPTLDPDNIVHNWQRLLAGLSAAYHFLLPLGALGLLTLLARRATLGLVVLAWFVLPILAYASWVWSVNPQSALPFLLIVFPPLLVGVIYLLRRVLFAPSDAPAQVVMVHDPYTGEMLPMVSQPTAPAGWRAAAAPVAAGLVMAAAVVLNLGGNTETVPVQGVLAQARQRDANLLGVTSLVSLHAQPQSIVIVDTPAGGTGAIYMLDILADWELYDGAMFSPRFARRLAGSWTALSEDGLPATMSRRRYEGLQELYDGATQEELSARVRQIVDEAIAAERPVYLLMSATELRRFEQAHLARGYELSTLAAFEEATTAATSESAEEPALRGAQWILARVMPEPEVPPATVVSAR